MERQNMESNLMNYEVYFSFVFSFDFSFYGSGV